MFACEVSELRDSKESFGCGIFTLLIIESDCEYAKRDIPIYIKVKKTFKKIVLNKNQEFRKGFNSSFAFAMMSASCFSLSASAIKRK